MDDKLTLVWTILNSHIAITLVAAAALWLLNKLYAKRPTWRAFEGTIIEAVKRAEKAIDDDSPNKSLRRLDAALRYTLDVYSQVTGKRASKKIEHEFSEAIKAKHSVLEAVGTLKKSAAVPE